MKKRMLALLLSAAMAAALLTGCGSSSGSSSDDSSSAEEAEETAEESAEAAEETEEAAEETGETSDGRELADTVTLGLSIDVGSFNPWLMAQDSTQQVYYNKIYEPLANLTIDGERDLVIAKSVESQGEGSYAIEIWDTVYDSAGNHITVDDVIYSFDMCIEAGQLAWATRYLDHIEKVDDYNMIMYTQDESAVGLDMLLKTVFIVSQDAYEASTDEMAVTPVGTGPYVLEEYVSGSSVTLTARDDYWQTDEESRSDASQVGSITTIEYKIITDSSQLSLALEMGEIEVAAGTGVSSTDYGNFMDDDRNALDGYTVVSYTNALIEHLELNSGEGSVLNNILLRQAVTYAIDKDAIVQNIFGSDASVCNTNSSPYYGDYDSSLDDEAPYPYDPDMAKELLAEAGYEEGEITLELICQNVDTVTKCAQLIAAYLEAVGIHCNVNIYEDALFQTSRADTSGTAWDICLNRTQGLNSPGRLGVLDINAYDTGMNGVYVTDDTLQDLYMEANLASSYSTETVTALLEYVDEMCYVVPLYYQKGYVIATDNVTEIALDRNIALIPGLSTIYAD